MTEKNGFLASEHLILPGQQSAVPRNQCSCGCSLDKCLGKGEDAGHRDETGYDNALINGLPITEKGLADRVCADLSPYFEIRREQWGTHLDGRRIRIDAIAWPKENVPWKGEQYFGIEFKLLTRHAGTGTYTRWHAQAIDYSYSRFGRNQDRRIPIYCCPGFGRMGRGVDLFRRMVGQFRVGELRRGYYGAWELAMSDTVVWREVYGRTNSKFTFTSKTGSR